MKIGSWTRLVLAASPLLACLLAGCGNFWEAPSTTSATSFSLSASPTSLSVAPGATSGTSTITVTPGSSFTGTVTLSCAVTSAPTGATSAEYPTCNFSATSLTFTSATVQSPTFTATALSTTPVGGYDITITGTSSGGSETTDLCVEVATSGTGTCTAASTSSGNFYILNENSTAGSGSIAGFSINSSALTALGSSQPVTGGNAVAIAPSGAFLYVASTAGGITLYPINSSGALQAGTNFNGDVSALALAVDPSGQWLLDASGSGSLTAYPITSTGLLDNTTRKPQSQLLTAITIERGGIAISPNGALIAVALGSTGTQIFTFGSGTLGGGNKPIKPTNTAGSAISVAMDPQSRFLYIGEVDSNSTANSGGLRVFAISGTNLAELNPTNPTSSGGVSPHAILPVASGNYVYVANGTGSGIAGNVTGFAVTSGITAGATVAAGADPLGLAEDSTAGWVFEVGSSGSPYFDAYTLGSTGQLTSEVTSTSAATSIAIVAAPK